MDKVEKQIIAVDLQKLTIPGLEIFKFDGYVDLNFKDDELIKCLFVYINIININDEKFIGYFSNGFYKMRFLSELKSIVLPAKINEVYESKRKSKSKTDGVF